MGLGLNVHVVWSSKENEIQAKGIKNVESMLHSKQSHELMLCSFFAWLWCWSSHFIRTDLILLSLNWAGRPLVDFDCAKTGFIFLHGFLEQWSSFVLLLCDRILSSPSGGRKQNQGCITCTGFLLQAGPGTGEELHPHCPSAVLFLSSPKCQSRQEQWCKKRLGGVQAGEGAKEGWRERAVRDWH